MKAVAGDCSCKPGSAERDAAPEFHRSPRSIHIVEQDTREPVVAENDPLFGRAHVEGNDTGSATLSALENKPMRHRLPGIKRQRVTCGVVALGQHLDGDGAHG